MRLPFPAEETNEEGDGLAGPQRWFGLWCGGGTAVACQGVKAGRARPTEPPPPRRPCKSPHTHFAVSTAKATRHVAVVYERHLRFLLRCYYLLVEKFLESQTPRMKEYKIVVVGNGGVGKSALTVQFVQGHFVSSYDATIEDSYRKVIESDSTTQRLEILDTAGTEQFSGMRDLYVRNGQGFVLVYSVDDPTSFAELSPIYNSIVRIKGTRHVPMILVGNKCDLSSRAISSSNGRDLARFTSFSLAKYSFRQFGCPFYETSAKTNHNVDEVFKEIARLIEVSTREPKSRFTLRTKRSGKNKEKAGCRIM